MDVGRASVGQPQGCCWGPALSCTLQGRGITSSRDQSWEMLGLFQVL